MAHDSYTRWGNVAAAALLFGMVFSGVGIWGIVRSAPTKSWPSTEGAIDESRVEAVGRAGPDEVYLRYSYSVEGQAFTGKRISYMLLISDAHAHRLVSEYSSGMRVRVYYDPAHPARSVLQPGGMGTAAVFLLAGLGLLGLWRHALRRAKTV